MTVRFAGGELSAFIPSDSTVTEGTTSSRFNPGFARAFIFCDKNSNYCEGDPGVVLTSPWLHMDLSLRNGTAIGGGAFMRWVWLDGSGVERIRITYAYSTKAFTLQYDIGAGWVTAGSPITLEIMDPTIQTIDLNAVVNSATGSLTLYIGGTERISSGTIDLTAITGLRKIRYYGVEIGGLGWATYPSQVIIADGPTIGWRLMTLYPSGAGADSAWTGTSTEVDETINNDADFINSATANQVETFVLTSVGSMTGYAPRAVIVAARAKRGTTGPQNLRFIVRSGGANHDNGADIGLGLGYEAKQAVFENDPATGAEWTLSALATLQAGVKSIT